MDEVSSAVSLGLVEDLDIDAEGGKPVVQRNESKIIRTEFWRLDVQSCWPTSKCV